MPRYDFSKHDDEKPKITEKTVTRRVLERIKKIKGVKVQKRGSSWNRAGEPDVTGAYKGVRFEIELKAPGKKPTTLQHKRMNEWKSVQTPAFWGSDPDIILKWFRKTVIPLGDALERLRSQKRGFGG